MKQLTFADAEYAGKRKQTRRERILIEMDQVVPWQALMALIAPYYPRGEGGARPPAGGHAACAPYAELVRLQRSGDGGSSLRSDDPAPLCRTAPGSDPGRNHHPQLPPPAGEKRAGQWDSGGHQWLSGRARPAAAPGQHRRCHDHSRAQFDEEQGRQARSGDAPDQEGQPVLLRHEGAYWRRRRLRVGTPRWRMSRRSTSCYTAKSHMSVQTRAIPVSKSAPSTRAARLSGRLPLGAAPTNRSASADCLGV